MHKHHGIFRALATARIAAAGVAAAGVAAGATVVAAATAAAQHEDEEQEHDVAIASTEHIVTSFPFSLH